MLSFLPPFLTGCLAALLLTLNTLLLCLPLFLAALLKLIIPLPAFQHLMSRTANGIAEQWISNNSAWMKLLHHQEFDARGLEGVKQNRYYLVTANHQSWADILIMQHLLNRRIPLMKFFLKQELIWIPVIGLCWWALDFPFMKRYSRATIKKHPERLGKDLETTRKACEKFRTVPVSIVNYLEGTRFTSAKHKKQQSPFTHLLKPRAGGISYVVGAMGDRVKTLLNVTIAYHHQRISFWDFLCGRVQKISIHFEALEIPESFLGCNYQSDDAFRAEFQQWVNRLWQDKDNRLTELKKEDGSQPSFKNSGAIPPIP